MTDKEIQDQYNQTTQDQYHARLFKMERTATKRKTSNQPRIVAAGKRPHTCPAAIGQCTNAAKVS